jgi:hypothetical protein
VEDGVVVVAIQTVLEEIARRERTLLCEKLDLNVAGCGIEHHLGRRLRLEIVQIRHVEGWAMS